MAAFPPGVSLGDGAPHSIMAPETLPLKSEKRDKEQQFKQNLLLQHNPPTCEPVDESNRRPSCISASAAITPPPVGETTPARAAGAVETPGAAAATETEGCLLQWFPGFDLPIGLKGRAILRRVLNQRRSLDAARCKQILSEHGIVLGRGVPGHTTNWGGLTVKELLHAAHLLGCWRQVEELCLSFCCSNGLKIEWVKELRAKGPHQVTLANLLSMKRNAAAEARRKRQQHTSTNAAAATSSSGASVAAAAATPNGKSGPTPEDIASATTVASTAATAAEGQESKLTIPGRRGGARQATPGLKLRKSCARARKGRIDYQQQQQQQHVQEGESTNSSTPTAAAAAADTNFSCSMSSLPLHPQTEDMPVGGASGGHSQQQQQQQQHILQSQPTAPENALVEGAFAPELCRSPRETPLRPSHEPPVFDPFEEGTRRSSNSRRNSRRQQQQQQKQRLLPMHAPPSGAPHHSGEAAAPAADVVPAFCTGISSWSSNYGGALHNVTELKGAPEGPPPGMPISPPFGASTWCVQQQELQQQGLQQQELQQQELQQHELQQQEQHQQQQPEQQHEQHQQVLLHHEQQQGASHMVFPDFQWTSGACAGEKKQEIAATASQPPLVPARAATAAEAAAAAAAQQLQLEDCYIETSYLYADAHQGTTISDAAAAAIPSEPGTAAPLMYDWSNHFQKAGNMQQQQTHLGAPQQWLSPMLPNYSGPPPPPPPSPRFSLPQGEMPGVTPLQLCAAQPLPSLASPCPLQLGKSGVPHDSSSDVSCASWRIKGSRSSKSTSSSTSCGVVPNYSGRVASNSSVPQRRTATRGTQAVAASRSRHRAKSGEAAADAAAAVATGYQQHRGAQSGVPSLQQLLASSSSDSCSCCSASSGDEDTPYPSLLPSQSVGFQYGEKEPSLQQQPQQIPLGSYVTTAVAGRVQEGMTKTAALGVPPSLHVSSPQRPWLHPSGVPYVEGFISGADAALATPGETAVEGAADSHATAQSHEGWWAGTDTPLLLSPGHTPVGAPPWNPSDTTHILFRSETLQQQQQQSFSLQPQQQRQLPAHHEQQPHQQQRQHTLLLQQEVTPGALQPQAQCAQEDEWGSSGPTSSSNSFPTDPNAVNLHGVTAAAAAATDAAAAVAEPVAVALQPDAADMHTAPPLLLQRKQQLHSLEQQQQQHNMQQPRQRRRAKGNGAERQVQKRPRNDSSRNTKRSEQQQPQKLLLQQEMNPCFPVQTQAQQQMLLQQAAVSNPQTAGICCSSSNLLRQQVSPQLPPEQEDYAASTAVGVGVSEAYSAVAAGQLFQSPWPLDAADPTAAAAAAACGSSGTPQGALQVAPPA
ncbi:hypothetical protein, conserved [Eimeria tenella]|uniref:Uncharacterized protein n=1 Tax=Eimeria tenella TaxID=5802 RepID=U6L9G5_EIMTE|nr:hypothetical protein, conserved [Eimeria tenella]CDJ45204.1 hypothetical protein, conserved [Eimeria tenella]|eukprot:XP_013235951.1 hypothetical protein, conserved [Eimeria tenella]